MKPQRCRQGKGRHAGGNCSSDAVAKACLIEGRKQEKLRRDSLMPIQTVSWVGTKREGGALEGNDQEIVTSLDGGRAGPRGKGGDGLKSLLCVTETHCTLGKGKY